MSEQRPTTMSDTEFDALIEGHIERSAAGQSEVPGEVFFDVLLERIAANASETVTLEVVGSHAAYSGGIIPCQDAEKWQGGWTDAVSEVSGNTGDQKWDYP